MIYGPIATSALSCLPGLCLSARERELARARTRMRARTHALIHALVRVPPSRRLVCVCVADRVIFDLITIDRIWNDSAAAAAAAAADDDDDVGYDEERQMTDRNSEVSLLERLELQYTHPAWLYCKVVIVIVITCYCYCYYLECKMMNNHHFTF